MSKFMQRIDDKVEGISQEVNNLKANTSQPERIDLINNLKREIDELKNENLEVRQRNATISYAMADLQTKVKDTENEKTASLRQLSWFNSINPNLVERRIKSTPGMLFAIRNQTLARMPTKRPSVSRTLTDMKSLVTAM
jgi:chromosome segregation ATPase